MDIQRRFITDDEGNPVRWLVEVILKNTRQHIEFDHDPTADEILGNLPVLPEELDPTTAAPRAQLKRLVRDALEEATLWEQAADKAESVSHPAAPTIRTESNRLWQRFLKLAVTWRDSSG